MSVVLETDISRDGCRRHPRAESFELHVYYLTYTLLRSSGVPQSVVYPTQASGVISTRFKNIILFSSGGGPRADMC